MLSLWKKKRTQVNLEQHELMENAQKRIVQKKWLFSHFTIFLIGSLFLILINKVLKYGEAYDWSTWTVFLWAFLFLMHAFNVFVAQKFMGRDWERRQREILVERQKKRIAEIQKEIETDSPLSSINKKKRTVSRLVIIAAAGKNNALGINNDLPWHLPDDFKRFKKLTFGHKIIMGRKTLESFPKPLPNREHIVVTRNKAYRPKFSCTLVYSLDEAIELVEKNERAYIIGGGEIYRQAMAMATNVELTRIHASFEADTFFPKIDLSEWELVQETPHPKDEKHRYGFVYQSFKRRKA